MENEIYTALAVLHILLLRESMGQMGMQRLSVTPRPGYVNKCPTHAVISKREFMFARLFLCLLIVFVVVLSCGEKKRGRADTIGVSPLE